MKIIFSFLKLVAVLLFVNGAVGCFENERHALLQLKASLVLDDTSLLTTWDSKSDDCCAWEGIRCNNHTGHVDMFHLSRPWFGPFPGEINASLMELRHLKYLNFSGTQFSNSIFSDLFGSFSNLRFLDLRDSFSGGRIPNDLAHLSHLQYLDLSRNDWEGTIPHQLGNLSHLQYLDLSDNSLDGTIPHQLGSLSKLQELHLGDNYRLKFDDKNNHVGGFDLNALLMWKGTERQFHNNKLILRSIDLSSNQLIGDIPKEIGNLIKLVSLNLSSNNLNGEITSEIGRLTSLEFLDLSRNHFFGLIPPSLAQIDRLSMLNLSDNNLSGRIPIGTQLQSFDASSYEGNVGLCGKPLDRKCPGDEEVARQKPEPREKNSSEDKKPIYLSVSLGFITGFWGLWGSLFLFRAWRHKYMLFLNNIVDTLYVFMVLNGIKFQRWLRALQEKFF